MYTNFFLKLFLFYFSTTFVLFTSSLLDRLHGGRKGKKKRGLSSSNTGYDGSLNSFGSSMRKSKSNTGTRRRTNNGAPSFTKRSSSVNKRRSKSGPGSKGATMSAAERRKQYSMQQRYPTKKKIPRGGGAGAIRALRGSGRSRSRDPVPKRRSRRAW